MARDYNLFLEEILVVVMEGVENIFQFTFVVSRETNRN